jgi:hypothetical protein
MTGQSPQHPETTYGAEPPPTIAETTAFLLPADRQVSRTPACCRWNVVSTKSWTRRWLVGVNGIGK